MTAETPTTLNPADPALRPIADKVLAELIEDMDLELPGGLIDAEMEFQLHRFLHRLEQQNIPIADYLRITGQDEQAFIADVREQGERSLSVRILLDAIADSEGIEVADEELEEAMGSLAEASEQSPEEYESALRQSGQIEILTGDILRNKVIDRLVEAAVPVDENGAELSLEVDSDDDADETEVEAAAPAEDADN